MLLFFDIFLNLKNKCFCVSETDADVPRTRRLTAQVGGITSPDRMPVKLFVLAELNFGVED